MTISHAFRIAMVTAFLALAITTPARADDDPYIPGAHIPTVYWKLPSGGTVFANNWRFFADPNEDGIPFSANGPPLPCRRLSVLVAVGKEADNLLRGHAKVESVDLPEEISYDKGAKIRVCKTTVKTEAWDLKVVFFVKHGRQFPQQVIRFLNKPDDYKLKK